MSCGNSSKNNKSINIKEENKVNVSKKYTFEEANKVFKELYFGIPQDSVSILGYTNDKDTTIWVYESNDPSICGITFDYGMLLFEQHKLFEVIFSKSYKYEDDMKADAKNSKAIFEAKYGKPNEEMLEELLLEIPDEKQYYKWDILHKHIISTISCSKQLEYKFEICIVDSVRAYERDIRIKNKKISEI